MTPKHGTIEELGLGARAERALHELGIRTVETFRALDVSKVLKISGCGSAVYQRLRSAQKSLETRSAQAPVRQNGESFEVLRASMGAWSRRCLRELSVTNLKMLAAVRFVDFIELRGFGMATWNEIACARRRAQEILGGVVLWSSRRLVRKPEALFTRPPTATSLLQLPLFSALEPERFGTPAFHPRWLADWPIRDLAVPVRAFALCDGLRITHLGELLMIPGTEFLARRNSHFGTLTKVHAAVHALLLGATRELQSQVDYTSFRTMVDSWLSLTLSATFAGVLSRRLAARNGRLPTYEQIARDCGITRARVGQIWEAATRELGRRQRLMVLDRFWNAVGAPTTPTEDCAALGSALRETFGWREEPPPAALQALLSISRAR